MEGFSHQDTLIQKLDSFIRKYYKNLLIKGAIYFTALFLLFFLTVSILEYVGNFNTLIRTVLFYSFLSGNFFILTYYVLIPLFRLFKIGKQISYKQAAEIIGNHFSNVKDKLLNTLQLRELANTNQNELIIASIQQKTNELSPIPFNSAINISENKKYIIYALLPLFLIITILLYSPKIITDSTKRIVSHGTYFEPPAPFHFNIENSSLIAIEGDDYELDVRLSGNEIPQDIFIEFNNSQFKLLKTDEINFKYIFKNPRNDISFRLFADGYSSINYTLKVVPKPIINGLNVLLQYPSYLKMKDEMFENKGDFTVPEGTKVSWEIHTKNSNELKLILSDSILLYSIDKKAIRFQKTLRNTLQYALVASNQYVISKDTIRYTIQVIPDQYPLIQVQTEQDTASPGIIYFQGNIQDDYGLRKLNFVYIVNENDKATVITIPINSLSLQQSFYHAFDAKILDLKPGDQIKYYFEVWDNDGVNGSKSTRTSTMIFRLPTRSELEKLIDKNKDVIKDQLSENMNQLKELDQSIQDLKKELMQKKDADWNDKNKLQKILDKQKELLQKFEEAKELNEKNNKQENELSEEEKRILEKQKALEKLFNEIKNDELMKLLEEMEKSIEKFDKNKLQEMLNKFQLQNKDLEKELDRTLELFKQLEFEQKLQNTIDKLSELQKQQEELMKKNDEKGVDQQKLLDEQKKLQNEFNQVKDDIKKLEELNNQLEEKQNLPSTDDLQKEIEQQMNNAQQQLQNKQNGKAKQSQQKANQKMQEMQQQLQSAQQSNQKEQAAENMEDLRQLLDNLLTLSFDQEAVMEKLKTINRNSPQYKELMKEQKKLKDDSKVIEDSLLALSKRMVELSSFVNKEISLVKYNMDQALLQLAERQIPTASQKQQYALTSINNLALMLSEALDQMQQQMQQQQSGNSSCTKPGKSNPNMSGLIQKQIALQQKMEQLKQKMEQQGKNKGEGKGNEGSEGEINKELVKLAAEQESLRKELQQLSESMSKEQKKMAQEIMKKMEENETDLLNKRITKQTLDRQKEINTRLLESEKAQREQDQDEKRQSNEGKEIEKINNQKMQEYLQRKLKETELLKTIPPALRPYYKERVSEYFNRF
ncbi:MAG: hypothetical protein N2167_10345 [Flavobacteriales bacterium]|nr:hypothetical protein [Flavobacteriales bacterium]